QTRTTISVAEFFRLMRLQRASVIAYLVAFIGLNALVYAVISWTPALYLRVHGWSEQRVGLAYGLTFLIAGIVGALGSGRLVGKLIEPGSSTATVKVIRASSLLLGLATAASALLTDA